MTISPFTPLFFYKVGGKRYGDGAESPYVQTFARTDKILVETFCGQFEEPQVILARTDGNTQGGTEIYPLSWHLSDGRVLRFFVLHGLSEGVYQLRFPTAGVLSHHFRVTADEAELGNTALLQYSMSDNKQRDDAVFIINGMRHFFDFRVPGGFKDGDVSFGCESEQFTTQKGDIRSLYALDTLQNRLTVGCSEGVPARFGEMINRLLCCSYVYVDGARYARKDASTPEISQQVEGVDSFVIKQTLQKVAHIDPAIESENMALLRRVDADSYRQADIDTNNYNRLID